MLLKIIMAKDFKYIDSFEEKRFTMDVNPLDTVENVPFL